MEKAGIRLNNGLDHGEAGRGFVRLYFAVTRAKLQEALDRIPRFLRMERVIPFYRNTAGFEQ